MKKLILVLLLIPSLALAGQGMGPGPGCKGYGAGGPSFTYDIWLDFESNSDCTDGELEKTDHNASAQTYTSGGSPNCSNNSAEKNGTYGVSFSGSSAEYLAIASGSSTAASVGFWVYLPTPGTWKSLVLVATGPGSLQWKEDGSTPAYLRMYNGSTGEVVNISTTNAWYWVSAVFTKNGNTQFKVWDASGTEVGESTALTGANVDITTISFGTPTVTTGYASTFYYDDFAIDWTDATYPLSPGP